GMAPLPGSFPGAFPGGAYPGGAYPGGTFPGGFPGFQGGGFRGDDGSGRGNRGGGGGNRGGGDSGGGGSRRGGSGRMGEAQRAGGPDFFAQRVKDDPEQSPFFDPQLERTVIRKNLNRAPGQEPGALAPDNSPATSTSEDNIQTVGSEE